MSGIHHTFQPCMCNAARTTPHMRGMCQRVHNSRSGGAIFEGDPRTRYRNARQGSPSQALPTEGDPRTRYTTRNAQPRSNERARANMHETSRENSRLQSRTRQDPQAEESDNSSDIPVLLQILGTVINEDMFGHIVGGARDSSEPVHVAAIGPRAAIVGPARASAVSSASNIPNTSNTPNTPNASNTSNTSSARLSPRAVAARMNCAPVDTEWLAATASVEDTDPPLASRPLDALTTSILQHDILSNASAPFVDNNDEVDSEWLAAINGVPDIDIPPEYIPSEGDTLDGTQSEESDAVNIEATETVAPLTDIERRALIDEMVADLDFVEHHPNEDTDDDDVSELGNTTIVPTGAEFSSAMAEELERLRAEVHLLRSRTPLDLYGTSTDEGSVRSFGTTS